jgi:hypothetical protein
MVDTIKRGFDALLACRPDVLEFSARIVGSYRDLVGAPLVPAGVPAAGTARLLYEAPFCVVAHNTEPDPVFVYANAMAQVCFEYSWSEFLTIRSRCSAEPQNRAERQTLLDAVTRDGFAGGYRGLRIAKSGRRFWIEEGVVWQVSDAAGRLYGQAAMFPRWRDA